MATIALPINSRIYWGSNKNTSTAAGDPAPQRLLCFLPFLHDTYYCHICSECGLFICCCSENAKGIGCRHRDTVPLMNWIFSVFFVPGLEYLFTLLYYKDIAGLRPPGCRETQGFSPEDFTNGKETSH